MPMTISTQANLRDHGTPARAGWLLAYVLCACGPGHSATSAAAEAAALRARGDAPSARVLPPQAAKPTEVAPRRVAKDTDAYAAAQRAAVDAPRASAGAAAPSDRVESLARAPELGLHVQLRSNGLSFAWSGARDAASDRTHLSSFESVEVRIEGALGSHAELVPTSGLGSLPLRKLGGGTLPDGHYHYVVSPHLAPISGAASDRVALNDSYADRPLREALRARAGVQPEASAEPELDLDGRNAHDPRIAARKVAALPEARGSFSIFQGTLALDEAEPDAPSIPIAPTSQAAPLHR